MGSHHDRALSASRRHAATPIPRPLAASVCIRVWRMASLSQPCSCIEPLYLYTLRHHKHIFTILLYTASPGAGGWSSQALKGGEFAESKTLHQRRNGAKATATAWGLIVDFRRVLVRDECSDLIAVPLTCFTLLPFSSSFPVWS